MAGGNPCGQRPLLPKSELQNLVQELPQARMAGGSEEHFRLAHFHNLTLIHKDEAVGDSARKAHFVGHANHGHAFFRQLDHNVQHFAHHFGVKGRGGFVKEHDGGLHGQGARNGNALLLPARKHGRVHIGLVADADLFEKGQ